MDEGLQEQLIRERDQARRERDQALEELACVRRTRGHSQDLFKALVDAVVDYAVFMLGPDGRVATWNSGAQRIKGYTASEIIGQPYETFFLPEDVKAGKPQKLLAQARELGHVEDEGWRMRKDGTRFWADAVITAVYGENGQLTGYAKITRDLTEREQLQRERLEALRQADKLKDQFVSILSHELRTPINAIMGFGSILDDEVEGPLNPNQRRHLQKMLQSAESLLGLVNDLLDISRMETGHFAIRPQPTDFPALVAEVASILRPLADQKRQALVSEVPEALPPVLGDDQRLKQVLINLINNAIKFTPPGGTISIRARLEGDALRCEVVDTGVGIEPVSLPRLFLPFSQVETAENPSTPGTGLGLAITKSIVEAHGGRVGVTSEPGAGSTFWFSVPVAKR